MAAKKFLSLALLALSAIGLSSPAFACGVIFPCKYQADLTFAHAPGLGFRNAGLYSAGYLWIWDVKKGSLTLVDDAIPMTASSNTEPPTHLSSSNIRGFDLKGDFPAAKDKLSLELAIGSKIEFLLEKGVRQRYVGAYTSLARAYRDADEDRRAAWNTDEVVKAKSGLLYVLVVSITRASNATISVGGQTGAGIANLSIKGPNGVSVTVGVNRGLQASCSGDGAPCFFEVQVIRGVIGPEPDHLLTFKTVTNYDVDALARAFRASH